MKFFPAALVLFASGVSAAADPMTEALEQFLNAELMSIVEDERIFSAINNQNAQTVGYDQARIDELDTIWRAEIGSSSSPTITPVLQNPLAAYLRDTVSQSQGRILEVFVMDGRGLNVAASAPTSDYWQGDEAKFTETYGRGAGATHISDIEFDESTQSYQGQISMTIVDPSSGAPIGAVTFGVDPEAL
jgi:hypothetical protein